MYFVFLLCSSIVFYVVMYFVFLLCFSIVPIVVLYFVSYCILLVMHFVSYCIYVFYLMTIGFCTQCVCFLLYCFVIIRKSPIASNNIYRYSVPNVY